MSSPVAMKLKHRIFELLGIRPFMDAWADGLQVRRPALSCATYNGMLTMSRSLPQKILRYNLTKAYNSHFDYLDVPPGSRFDTRKIGNANR
jgi:hypothetical protein